MGSSQSILSKEDLEAYKQLTYFTEAEIKNCLQRFSELLDPNIPLKSVHDPQANYSSCLFSKDMILQARILHEDVVNGLQELKVNPFAKRICRVFSPNPSQMMSFEEFLDMLSSLSVATPPSVRAEWAFKIFDSDEDQLLGERDIRSVVDAITGTDETAYKSLDVGKRDTVVKNVLRETDLNRTGQISLAEFKQMVIRSPDFVNNFRIRL